MKVVILVGGKGTRLSEETVSKPKPMVNIGDKPILWHIMKIYSSYGFNDFILLLGYKGEMIIEYFDKFKEDNWQITYVDSGLESLKSQRIKMAKEYITEDYFFVAYGDDVSDVNISEVFEFHKKHGKVVSLTAIPLESNYGVLEINDSNLITSFKEKPIIEGYWINGGFFCFSKKILSLLNNNEELEDDLFIQLALKGEIAAFKHPGFWKSMNTLKDRNELNILWKERKAPWKVW